MFEWDEEKCRRNLNKHGLDFRDAHLVFDGRPALHVPSRKDGEERFVSIARLKDRFYTVVWTWRSERRRIISFRRARDGEERAYRKAFGGRT